MLFYQKTFGICYMSCMHAKFDHEETCIDLCTMQHMLYSKSPSDRWDFVLFVTIFILVIMNAYTHIS